MLKPLMKYGYDGGISSCGGYIYSGDEVLYDCPMTEEQKNKLFKLFSDSGVFLSVEGRDDTFNDLRAEQLLGKTGPEYGLVQSMIRAVWVDLGPRSLEEYDGRPVYKMVFSCTDARQVDAARNALDSELKFIVHDFSQPDCVFGEVINRRIDKGKGVRIVADKLGFDIADTIGFGDSMLDIEMIEAVGTSVCMDNGSPKLKEISDLICPSVDNDGIEWAFRKLGLI
jgi:hydroxymethylpyrimidine pyrophosphatase-like HAD family hydrolase